MPVVQISRRSSQFVYGRNDSNVKVIVPRLVTPSADVQNAPSTVTLNPGDYCVVKIRDASSQTLHGHFMQTCAAASFDRTVWEHIEIQ
ncbi:hypothetical protein D915_006011 [Fasciola hepatica]|uniref:Uncharacterized protein n=1 Tax=Fasciola hepatica TaxID=6192 RepID=A0A2H1C7J8_FASHE|nr:hypothetical protein D915_006011 [Fasciola hepatica]